MNFAIEGSHALMKPSNLVQDFQAEVRRIREELLPLAASLAKLPEEAKESSAKSSGRTL